jgi:predicted Zn-dependent peptidase
VVHIPDSSHVSIFTFVPLGLCTDGPGQAQWSHLIEHLVIRSTVPEGSTEANAETLPDHMRLDWYGRADTWQTGLDHHVKWLTGTRFTPESMATEKRRVLEECDNVARRGQTHKFALAAWWQAHRFGAKHVALKGDVEGVDLAHVELHRASYFARLDQIVVCVVGGLDHATVLSQARARLEAIEAPAAAPPALPPQSSAPEAVTWDLQATHLVLVWPIPDAPAERFAALAGAGPWLSQQCSEDPELKANAGPVIAGTDLVTPKGTFLYVSAPLASGGDAGTVRAMIEEYVYRLSSGAVEVEQAAGLGRQLAEALVSIPDPVAVARQAPNLDRGMVEGNLGLQYGMNEFRFGDQRETLTERLTHVTVEAVRRAAAEYVTPDRASLCILRPAQP